jgi:DNA-binding NtrC family response regulator
MNTLLVVDDEESVRYSFSRMFEDECRVLTAEDGYVALDILNNSGGDIDVVFLDVRMPGIGGIEVLKKIKEKMKNLPVIIITAFSDSVTAIEAMKEGAFDYLIKPFEIDHLKEVFMKAIASSRLQHETLLYNEIEELSDEVDTIVGNSKAIVDVCKMVGQAAGSDVPVLITGESGVGKEIVARAVYNHSDRKGKPFMAVNCAALPEGVVESELFGSEKGAFTGAEIRRIGRFEQCDKGVIFLDEIGDMSLSIQAKLLRVLQDGSFERVGSNNTIKTNVRVIAASNKSLSEGVTQGGFREDLYHRLNVFSIYIPPLRERKEDIPVLSEYFISRAVRTTEKQIRGITPEAIKLLMSYSWPGNVRELENVIRRAVVVASSDIIDVDDIILSTEPNKKELHELSEVIQGIIDRAVLSETTSGIFRSIVSSTEKTLIEKVLKITKGNQVQAAEFLGITRVTLRKKMQDFNISSE